MFSGHETLLELILEGMVEEKTTGVGHDYHTSGHVKKIVKNVIHNKKRRRQADDS